MAQQTQTGSTGGQGKATGDAIDRCIKECLDCYAICASTIQDCLSKGGKHAAPDHIRLLLDCVEICRTSADFMIRGSDLHRFTCGTCAEVCDRCAKDCEAMGEDEMMKRCAETCRRCSESCHRMSAGTH